MDRIRTGVFYYCPVCGQPSASTIPQSECLTCAASRSAGFATWRPPIPHSPTSTPTTTSSSLSSDGEDGPSSSLLWHVSELNYGALDLEAPFWRCTEDSHDRNPQGPRSCTSTSSVGAVAAADADADEGLDPDAGVGAGAGARNDTGNETQSTVWLAVLMGICAVIGAGITLLVLL